MSEWLVAAAIVVAAGAGVPGLFARREGRAGERLFVALLTAAALLAAASALGSLVLGTSRELAAAWPVPGGRLSIQVDALSAVFVLPIALLAGLGAWYGLEYWPQRARPGDGRKLRAFYGAVTAGMLLLVVAQNAILFLAGWEIMAAAAFVLVSTEDTEASVREVGYVYLLSTRAGTLCLFAMFALLGAASGSLDMRAWSVALESPAADAIFLLALAGFGLKAGVMPLHVWLPGAHASAPSHVSAVMSGVLIKTGIYGLVRLTALAGAPPLWWGYALVALGALSGVLGVGFAIGQHDIKRLLAYHSVENIGIICLGLGVAVLGKSMARPELVALGLAGALLHVWNHGLFKGLLFLAAGSVVHATGTRAIDQLGGLWRRMPRTGGAFLVGSVAICGLPPLNGLVSELLVYLGLFGVAAEGGGPWLAGALAVPALALVGALAVACFVKVFGAVFLGHARSAAVERAHEAGPAMLAPMAVLASLCVAIGLGAPAVALILDGPVRAWAGAGGTPVRIGDVAPLAPVAVSSAAIIAALAILGWWLARRVRAAPAAVGTWDCGYAAPDARMQYTASSFAEMIVRILAGALRPATRAPRLDGPFPARAGFHSHVPDTVLDRGIVPGFSLAGRTFARLRPIQHGNTHLYLLYILGTLLALLLWT
ncbi:MAG TPA: proton-conducting transporter membrane subunit [Kofleriaceae bacterium]|nr:proton-conducting transporter membrane subunit [Kofleriaceae bacterium]